jgi:FAD/FMN-containing dehydrogenase
VNALAGELRALVGAAHVLEDADLRASYERDWTGRFGGPARLVVRPGDTGEVAAVLRACAMHGAAVVPQGGNTGLVGGGVPRGGEVVLSTGRLTALGAVDAALGHVEAGAGVTLGALQRHARAAGLDAGLDLGARDTATLGGIVACDAGGPFALRYGTARARVAGLEAVLADGSVIRRLSGLAKDNAGYDLPALLIGSEGTLAAITTVLWKLVPVLPKRLTALVGLPDAEAAAGLLAALRAEAPSLAACEFMTEDGLELVLAHLRRRSPVRRAPFYVLVELADRSDPTDELAAAFERAGVEDAAVADDTASRERLWALREAHTEAISAAGVPLKLDVGVPLRSLARFLRQVRGGRTILFGHLGDGNVHVNLLGAEEAAGEAVLDLVLACGGTISAEHGIGVAKAHRLADARGEAEVAAMRAIKAALDPAGMLNPGAVLA